MARWEARTFRGFEGFNVDRLDVDRLEPKLGDEVVYRRMKVHLLTTKYLRSINARNLPSELMGILMDVCGLRVGWQERTEKLEGENLIEKVTLAVREQISAETPEATVEEFLHDTRSIVARYLFFH